MRGNQRWNFLKIGEGNDSWGSVCHTEWDLEVNQVGTGHLRHKGENMLKLRKSLGFLSLPPNYSRRHSGQEEECCQVSKKNVAGDLVWESSDWVQNSGATMDCFYTPGPMQNMDFSIDNNWQNMTNQDVERAHKTTSNQMRDRVTLEQSFKCEYAHLYQ